MPDEDVDRAIQAAGEAFKRWRFERADRRAEILHRWRTLILEDAESLAYTITVEGGKPIKESRAEVLYAASFIEWFAEEGKRAYGDVIPSPQDFKRILVLKQPIGVAACITPWNFPAAMVTRKVSTALAAGCTVVLKPAEQTPLTALRLCHLAERAGLPAGVLNVVTGNPQTIGSRLTSDPRIGKISFTGSTEVGKQLMAQCAPTLKRMSLELGGNAPFIVFADADLDVAVDGLMVAQYRNSGQTCVCSNRIFVQNSIYDVFLERLVERTKQLIVGNGLDPNTEVGPLIDAATFTKVGNHVVDAKANGGKVLCGGEPDQLGLTFYRPTVITDVNDAMLCTKEETFGPVAAVRAFSDEDEALAIANSTRSGLAAYFFTRDIGRAWYVAESLEVGIASLNAGLFSTTVAPFGGVKESGLGREGSRYGLDEFMQTKYFAFGGLRS